MSDSAILQTGPLPKLKGSGRKPQGLWPGHENQASELRRVAGTDPDSWSLVCSGMKPHAASRVARLINRGEAKDFPVTDAGHYRAVTRKGETGQDLWAQYVPQS